MSRKPRPWGENQQITASTGQRWRQAIERAATVPRPGRGSKFSAAELRAVMSGLSYWLLSRDRTDGEVTLAQIAQASGLWHGEHEDCPREITKALGAAASYLARYRAINYRPGGSRGRGSPSWFGAPELAEGSFLDRKSSTGPRTLEARNDPERWERALEVRWVPGAPPTDPLGGFPAPRKGGSRNPPLGKNPRRTRATVAPAGRARRRTPTGSALEGADRRRAHPTRKMGPTRPRRPLRPRRRRPHECPRLRR